MQLGVVVSSVVQSGKAFPKDAGHGPHGPHKIHLGSCYMGPASYNASIVSEHAKELNDRTAGDFSKHEKFGNAVVYGESRKFIAEILGTDSANISLTVNTNMGLQIIKHGLGLKNNDKVLLFDGDYLDVKVPYVHRDDIQGGCTPVYVKGARDDFDRRLGFDLQDVEKAIKENDISLVVITHVQFTSGFNVNLAELAKICRDNNVDLVVDIAQSFGALEVKPDELGISAVVSPLWKWIGGEKGTAFLWTSPEFRKKLDSPFLSASGMEIKDWLTDVSTAALHKDGRVFETSTLPTSAWIITREMLRETSQAGIQAIQTEIRNLQQYALDLLSDNERIGIYRASPDQNPDGSFISVFLKAPHAGREQEIVERLQAAKPKPILITARGGFIRIAAHKFSSVEAVTEVCTKLREAVMEL